MPPKKISKKLREQAAFALELAANNHGRHPTTDIYHEFGDCPTDEIPRWSTAPITMLMQAAWLEVPGIGQEAKAEAAQLLRDGWSPGDPTTYVLWSN